MIKKRWGEFLWYLGRVFILLILLAILLPKLASMCSIWISSHLHDEQRPTGNPMRVEIPGITEFVTKNLSHSN